MPIDPYEFDEEDGSQQEEGRRRRFSAFDCPTCNANNPLDESFGDGDEVLCFYCGTELKARVSEEGKLSLREL